MLDVRWGAVTDVGRVRRGNEDNFVANGTLFAVADGMGGHLAGEVASQIAIDTLRDLVDVPLSVAGVTGAILQANESIQSQAGDPDSERVGMGTTLVGLAVVQDGADEHWLIFNIGDSRLYRFADGGLAQVTVDHSEIQELVESGSVTSAEALTHPQRNVITKALGSVPAPVADLWLVPRLAGERYLLCSDGLSNELRDEDIAALFARALPPQETAYELVRQALESGGRDNVTVIVVEVGEAGSSEDAVVDETTIPRPAPDHLVREVPTAAKTVEPDDPTRDPVIADVPRW
jgi:serine/threonine protein phosphatase PrpC